MGAHRLDRALDGREHHADDGEILRIRMRRRPHLAENLARRLDLLLLAGYVNVRADGRREETDRTAQTVAWQSNWLMGGDEILCYSSRYQRTHHASHERLEETALKHRVDHFLLVGFDRHRSHVLRNDDGITVAE